MGLFGKLLGSAKDDEFDANYNQLKEYAKEIMKYSNATPKQANKANEIIPVCDDFLAIVETIDRKKANTMIRKEAKADSPRDRIPYHSDFKVSIFGSDDMLESVIRTVNSIKSRFVLWDKKIAEFNDEFSSVPSCEIQLSDEFVKRGKMIEIPEIKYATVGKAFNKDKLLKFVVIDTETTGLKASSERIIQLSAVKYVDWQPVEVWNTYIDPKREIPKEASSVNGITDDMVKGKPTIKQVAKSFVEFVGDWDVVGYNLPFDYKFLYAEGIDLTEQKRKYYDVLSLAKKVYKNDLYSFTLTDVAEYNKIFFDAHNSLNDCYATGLVFKIIIDEITNG